jgi:excisionase family DNA binding protein
MAKRQTKKSKGKDLQTKKNNQQNLRKKYLSSDEAALYLSLKLSTLYQLTSKKKIPHSKVGRLNIFDSYELDTFIQQHKVHTIDEIKQTAIDDYVLGKV